MAEQSTLPPMKLFDKYDLTQIVIQDPALKQTVNIEPRLTVKSLGKNFGTKGAGAKVNIVERLVNRIGIAGHRGKKHKLEVGQSTGKYTANLRIVLEAFEILEKQTGQNPVQVLVKAIENSAPRDETTVIEYGGARYPQAVDVSPLRRVNVALRNLTHGGSDRAFNKKKTFAQGLAEEIKLAAENNGESTAVRKKNESEKQADSAR